MMNTSAYYDWKKVDGIYKFAYTAVAYNNNGQITCKTSYDYNGQNPKVENLSQSFSLLATNTYSVKDSHIKNRYYTGDKFDVSFKGYKAKIVNQRTKQEFELDVEKLLDNKYVKDEEKKQFLVELRKLPGEVLADLAKECNFIGSRDNMSEEFNKNEREVTGQYMSHSFNSGGFAQKRNSLIFAKPERSVITHELGHLVSYNSEDAVGKSMNGKKNWAWQYSDTFSEELAAYKKYLASTHPIRIRIMDSNGECMYETSPIEYCAENEDEFFAEAYTLLMLGNSATSNNDVITKFFPKSFKMVKERISEIRKMDSESRNKDIYTCNERPAEGFVENCLKIQKRADDFLYFRIIIWREYSYP